MTHSYYDATRGPHYDATRGSPFSATIAKIISGET